MSPSLKRALPLLVLLAGACDDGLQPNTWNATPDTLVLYSASRPEYVNLGSGLDITSEPVTTVPLEAPGVTGNWDFALLDVNGGLALVPAITIAPVTGSRARLLVVNGASLESVDEAPSDSTRYTAQALTLQTGAVYVLRSRRASCGYTAGSKYAKLQPVDVDVARGVVRFAIVRNPYCDIRSLVPPEG
ncbi:MAG TPA: hypothetical protein VK928_06825 [Longimicrobiales bacterium]|nr:hypothetical protein [Longimicrobiales bacterium]